MPHDSSPPTLDTLLAKAIREHQQGRLEAAEPLYRQVLALAPDHPDGLHLCGMLHHQQGNHVRAIELIRAAIRIAPEQGGFHANLAEAYRSVGQFEEAVACCRRALQFLPESAQIANNLGLALMAQHKLADARIAQFESAVGRQPDYPEAHNNLGNALREQGHHAAAVTAYRRAVQCKPDLAPAHSNLGQLLTELGQHEQALEHCQEAARLAPRFAAVHNNLGNVLRKLGRLSEAKQHYGEAIRLAPSMAMAYNNIGQVLEEEDALDAAIECFEQALQREPRSARFHTNMARVLLEQDDLDAAAGQLESALQFNSQYAEAHEGLGDLLRQRGQLEEAVSQHREAIRLNPTLASAHWNLGRCLMQQGQDAQAEPCFRAALRLDPLSVSAWADLAALLATELPDVDAARMQELIDGQLLSDRKRARLHYALANVRDAQNNFAAAAQHARQANILWHECYARQQRTYDAAVHEQFVDRVISVFDAEFFQRTRQWGLQTDLPIFHVGMPRAGKSLAEQLLASHPQVFGAGELKLVRQSLNAFPGALGIDVRPLDAVHAWTKETVQAIAQRHLDKLQMLAPTALRIVDTMPHNYLHLGLIVTLFPRARIVHCRRDLRDTTLACWFKEFKHLAWACDLQQIVGRISQYQRIMDHWRRVLPHAFLELDYEEVVAEPAVAARQLVNFVGLSWHPSCGEGLDRAPRPTVHSRDAQSPIGTQFVGRWSQYHAALGSAFDKLPV